MSDTPPLLDRFRDLVERFETIHGWIVKARELADDYSDVVVDKVVAGHTATLTDIAIDIVPVLVDVESRIAEVEDGLAAIQSETADATTALEELELRKLIGELDDEGFDAAKAEHQAPLDEAEPRRKTLQDELDTWTALHARWTEAGEASGVLKAQPEAMAS